MERQDIVEEEELEQSRISVILRHGSGESTVDNELADRVVNYVRQYTGMYHYNFIL